MEENKQYYTPEEWVNSYNKENDTEYSSSDCNYTMMERYANYKSKMLEAKVLTFRQYLQTEEIDYGEDRCFAHREISDALSIILEEYDKHFGIIKTTEGKI